MSICSFDKGKEYACLCEPMAREFSLTVGFHLGLLDQFLLFKDFEGGV